MHLAITHERPDTSDSTALISELDAVLSPYYPEMAKAGYSVQRLLRKNIIFFVIRCNGEAAGCGGIEFFGKDYAELKRMYTRPPYRGRGLAKLLLDHLSLCAIEHNVLTLRLETREHQSEAIALYEHSGFARIASFGKYVENPSSACYEKKLERFY